MTKTRILLLKSAIDAIELLNLGVRYRVTVRAIA
jgi:hypothetical protein